MKDLYSSSLPLPYKGNEKICHFILKGIKNKQCDFLYPRKMQVMVNKAFPKNGINVIDLYFAVEYAEMMED